MLSRNLRMEATVQYSCFSAFSGGNKSTVVDELHDWKYSDSRLVICNSRFLLVTALRPSAHHAELVRRRCTGTAGLEEKREEPQSPLIVYNN